MKRSGKWDFGMRLLLFVCCLIVSGVSLSGCSKKGDEPNEQAAGEVVSETATEAVSAEVSGEEGPGPEQDEELTWQEAEEILEREETEGSERVKKVFKEEIVGLLKERKGTSQPVTEEEEILSEEEGFESVESGLAELALLEDSQEKIGLMEELAEQYPQCVGEIVWTALDDEDSDVRLAAVELLLEMQAASVEVVSKAFGDSEEEVRVAAVEALEFTNEAEAGELLIAALDDESEDVRMGALDVADEKDEGVLLDVLGAGIGSAYEDVKETAVSSLIDLSNHAAVDILIEGLRDPDAEFREEVSLAIEFLISEEFAGYEEANQWWEANRDRFDEELNEIDTE